MEFNIDLAASLEILIPKGASTQERSSRLGGVSVKQLKNGETKFSMKLMTRGKYDFADLKKNIMVCINDIDLPDRKILAKIWIKFEIYDVSFISIYFDSGFLKFLASRDIEIHLENRN